MLMRKAPNGTGDGAYAQLARQYPSVVLILDACFTACSAVAHAYRLARTRRILHAFDCDRLRDIGLTRADLRNGRLDHVLRMQAVAARPEGPWARAWSWLLKADRYCKSLAAFGEDQVCSTNDRHLKIRRETHHECKHGCAGRISGAQQ